ncbi:dihydrolipoyl dehydrogenase [Methylobacterium oryzihabitans]|uniref:Dihydrolipoyl dehydrogenase n=1 Tax=Methylobacterium oryzihabitans TaxID=2499852 RepID=A0A3S2YLF1_9HYPH|nr:dihydrolipoyl dehydrogenase [Methylobacterium oryzihabitans]RVU13795.1 dihydrolipoyl dehydrogenase [Methylobacterium oryzihabitans]
MQDISCDVAVIGAGTAGLAARAAANRAGASTVLIERGPGGTTCARVGCMPSKLLIAAARAAHEAGEAGLFGVEVAGIRVDGAAVMRRVRRERDRFVAAVLEGVEAIPARERIAGTARFADATTLLVDDHTRISARAVVVAAGSSPSVPPPLRPVADRVLTTDTVFEIADLPDSLAVLGAGAVGLELAQAMSRLGVRVTLFDPSSAVAGLSDPEIAAEAASLIGRDFALHLGAEVTGAEPDGDGLRLHWRGGDGTTGSGSFARVLAAAGRPPNLEPLDLARTGLDLDEHGLPDFNPRTLQCGASPIFLAGDVNHERPVLHEASRQGTIAGGNAARYPQVEAPPPWPAFSLVYTDPEIAVVGEAFDGDRDRIVGSVSLADQGRARVMGRNAGAIRLYADPADGRLVGGAMVGPEAEHLSHLLAIAVQEGWTAGRMLDRPFYHPTVEEGLQSALKEIAEAVARRRAASPSR